MECGKHLYMAVEMGVCSRVVHTGVHIVAARMDTLYSCVLTPSMSGLWIGVPSWAKAD
jgi:hypothetical protein